MIVRQRFNEPTKLRIAKNRLPLCDTSYLQAIIGTTQGHQCMKVDILQSSERGSIQEGPQLLLAKVKDANGQDWYSFTYDL